MIVSFCACTNAIDRLNRIKLDEQFIRVAYIRRENCSHDHDTETAASIRLLHRVGCIGKRPTVTTENRQRSHHRCLNEGRRFVVRTTTTAAAAFVAVPTVPGRRPLECFGAPMSHRVSGDETVGRSVCSSRPQCDAGLRYNRAHCAIPS